MNPISYPLGHNFDEMARLEEQARLLEDPLLTDLARRSHRILEIGCGVGSNWSLIRAASSTAEYLGIDLATEAVREAKMRYPYRAQFQEMNATDLTLPSLSFDLVFTKLVLWSLGDAASTAIDEALRVLVPGGVFYSCEPANRMILFEPRRPKAEMAIEEWDKEARLRGWDPSIGPKVAAMLMRAGFVNVQTKALPIVALASDKRRFTAICDNLRRFILADSSNNPSTALTAELKNSASSEFMLVPKGGVAMDFVFVSWGEKTSL